MHVKFRICLFEGNGVKPKKLMRDIHKCLLSPGADLVVCDEGHTLKTEKTNLSKSVNQVETRRRIVLTGTPLQNNLAEYYCMVSFVKPNLLGTLVQFKNRFVNPINNGQHKDSTEADVRVMKKRAHVLHNMLDHCVQRKDYSVIKDQLPPKREYVLSVRLSSKQVELYRAYLRSRNLEHGYKAEKGRCVGAQLFADFHELSRVSTHPWAIKINETRQLRNEERAAERDFINDADSDDTDGGSGESVEVKSEPSVPSPLSIENLDEDDDDIIALETLVKPKRLHFLAQFFKFHDLQRTLQRKLNFFFFILFPKMKTKA